MAQGEATAAETVAGIRRRVTDLGAIIGEETSTTTALAELLALVESGAAEEAWLYLLRGTSTVGISRAVDLAITQGVDVVSTSRHVTSDTDCDGMTDDSNHGTWVDNPGAMVVAILAMTDRWGAATSGFSSMHGGGRFQARRYSNADHQGAWGWQSYGPAYLSSGQSFQVNVSGSGNEPATINQFKAYAVFPEDDPSDVANIDLFVYDQNCGAGATLLGADTSFDVKSMVRLNGSQAAGKALCVKVTAPHVPSGETRPVTLFMYYSYDTTGR